MYFSRYLSDKFPTFFMGYNVNMSDMRDERKSFWFIFGSDNFVKLIFDMKLKHLKMGKYLYNEYFRK